MAGQAADHAGIGRGQADTTFTARFPLGGG
jgi:hypothetical protein